MSINNVKSSNLISKSIIEDNKDLLSNEEKEKLLSIFDSIDKNEEDNQKGVITTEEGLNNFLREIKNNISDKYNKFLDSVGLSHLKNDKNFNSIIDKDDFDSEQWEKITAFAPFMRNGTKWTKDIYMLINKIFDRSENKNNTSDEVIVETNFAKYAILYDDKTRTVKSVMFNDSNGYVVGTLNVNWIKIRM